MVVKGAFAIRAPRLVVLSRAPPSIVFVRALAPPARLVVVTVTTSFLPRVRVSLLSTFSCGFVGWDGTLARHALVSNQIRRPVWKIHRIGSIRSRITGGGRWCSDSGIGGL